MLILENSIEQTTLLPSLQVRSSKRNIEKKFQLNFFSINIKKQMGLGNGAFTMSFYIREQKETTRCGSSFPTFLMGEELYTQMVFFVQSILANQKIRRRELWVVSV